MKKVIIKIKDMNNQEILTTNNETYKEDLKNNKEKLKLWWRCNIEYDNGLRCYDYPCNHDGLSPRRLIEINGKYIFADYNFEIEGEQNIYNTLLKYFNEDFETK